jgi:hypothetical protein
MTQRIVIGPVEQVTRVTGLTNMSGKPEMLIVPGESLQIDVHSDTPFRLTFDPVEGYALEAAP